ncbi:MAG: tetratricopeptide repeat protein [Lachnospiraceae bacterium]
MKKFGTIISMIALSLCLTACGGKSASDYNKEGMEYYNNHDYDHAEDYLAKALEADSDNTEYKQNYAMILIQQGKQDEAIEQFEATISDKTSSSALKNNKYAYRGIGMAYIQKQEYDKAVEYFDKALEIDKEKDWDTDIRYYKANAMLLGGDTEGALELYNELLEEDSENFLVYQARANVYRDKGDYAAALADYNSALLYCEGGFELYIGLAACYMETGHQEEAEEALFLASLLDIKTDEDKYYLGVIHYYEQEYDSAKAEMEYALKNGFTEAYFYLGEICMFQKDYEAALGYYEQYVDSTVTLSPTVCNDIAVCYIYAENYDAADEWLQKGLGFANSNVLRELKRNEIACLEGQGDLSGAFAKLSAYIAEYPDDEGAKTEYEFLKDRVS